MKAFTATAILVYCATLGQAAPVAAPEPFIPLGNPNFVNSLNARDAAADPGFLKGLSWGAQLGSLLFGLGGSNNDKRDISELDLSELARREADPGFPKGFSLNAQLASLRSGLGGRNNDKRDIQLVDLSQIADELSKRDADPLFKTGLKWGARVGNQLFDINDDGEGGIFKREAQPGFLSGLKWGARLGSELFDFGGDDNDD